ncbi:hypothetical protein E2562_001957 [Oryza meyeriana var. granulata]|uniref:Uncharacterized protein n=1 Tax=Oryza meyeriana var. granulata TaxID=110450 RepID=A0A6G1C4B4_9ORYZ|nr:hypothetical protein E2562_001957 [Oryza meyeriana var. granulata]
MGVKKQNSQYTLLSKIPSSSHQQPRWLACTLIHLWSRLLRLLCISYSHASAFPYLHLHHLPLSTAASSATVTPFSIKDYLIGTYSLTSTRALKATKKVSHLKSATNPDAVLTLLSSVGLSHANLATTVAANPLLLYSTADNLARRIASLRNRVRNGIMGLAHLSAPRY